MHGKKHIKSECDYIGFRYNRLNYKCKECGNICHKSINGLIKKFPRIYKFCNGDLNKFVLLLRKGVYPYEYMDSWERFDETSLPDKKPFYRDHAIKVSEVFEIKDLGEYHDLYVQSDRLLLADVF